MAPIFSKPALSVYVQKHKGISASVIAIILLLIKLKVFTKDSVIKNVKLKRDKKAKGQVDMQFVRKVIELIKIVIPSWKCIESFDMVMLTVFLVLRTFLSIHVANVNGRIVKAIVQMDGKLFIKRIFQMALVAIPASFVNSYLDFLNKRLSLHFRKRMTDYFHSMYLKNLVYYQISNLDSRISNVDQRMTADIEKWASSLSLLYSNFSKPLLDIILFSRKLSELVGWRGPLYIILWYFFSGCVIRLISPPFGKLTAIEQKFEGDYRGCHSDLVYHSEEIAFYRGNHWEKTRINNSFDTLIQHSEGIMVKKLLMGVFDSLLVKYGAVMVGYSIVGLPVFGSKKEEYLKSIKSDPSKITRDYVRNSSLLINLAKAIGRIVVSYKEIQQLAGYTTLVAEMKEVLHDLNNGVYNRVMLDNATLKQQVSINSENIIETEDYIQFQGVPITSPNGDKLVSHIEFQLKPGMNCIITGPNGCGKSSLFRILGGLWPLFDGKLYRPSLDKLFYVPQRAYLPPGNLRDQIIYPHSKLQMLRKKIKDADLIELLKKVNLEYIVQREGGFDKENDWKDVLSGGEKQRMAMARLFYHKPMFAILDECTSAVSMDVESQLYQTAKEMGITLLTVSHRQGLFKFHDYLLRLDGEGGWSFEKFKH